MEVVRDQAAHSNESAIVRAAVVRVPISILRVVITGVP
jgi:hypothetical protein